MTPGPRFALVAFPPARRDQRPTIIAITEDALTTARSRHWLVLAADSEVYPDAGPLDIQSNPRRVADDKE